MEPIPLFSEPADISDENCSICLQKLNNQAHTCLSPCKHHFHTDCIIKWFRSGSPRCPLCNDTSTQIPRGIGERYKLVRAYARRKNAPKRLKKYVDKLKKTELTMKDINHKIRELYKESGVFSELLKKKRKLRTRLRVLKCRERRYRRLLGSIDIVPLYMQI